MRIEDPGFDTAPACVRRARLPRGRHRPLFAVFLAALVACGGSDGAAIDGAPSPRAAPDDGTPGDGLSPRGAEGGVPGADAALVDGAPGADGALAPDASAASPDASVASPDASAADSSTADATTSGDASDAGDAVDATIPIDASDAGIPDANAWLDAPPPGDAGWASADGGCVIPESAWTALPPEVVGPPEVPPTATSVLTVPLVASAIAYDAPAGVLYAVTPASNGAGGNALVTVDPWTGAVASAGFIGSDPTALTVSRDGRYVYAALSGAEKVQRYDTAAHAPDIAFVLGQAQGSMTLVTEGFFPLASSHGSVIALVAAASGGNVYSQNVVVFDDGVPRPGQVSGLDVGRPYEIGGPLLATGTDALWLAPESTFGGMNYLCANAAGVFYAGTLSFPGGWATPGAFGAGELTSPQGDVFDARTMTRLGSYHVDTLGYPLLVLDEGLGRVVFLVGVEGAQGGIGSYALVTFDHATRALVSRIDFTPHTNQWPVSIVRFGEYGFAVLSFTNASGEIDLVRSPLLRKHP